MRNINWKFVFSATVLLLGVLYIRQWLPGLLRPQTFGGDWSMAFKPAIQELFAGHDPYTVPGFLHPTWMLVLMAPFALLPMPFDVIAIVLVGAAAYVYALRRLGASWFVTTLFMLTPQLWWSLMLGNSEWLIALGFVLSPPIGLIFASVKPQACIGLAIFWAMEAWHKGGIREVIKVCAPVFVLTLLSFAFFGFWISKMSVNVDVPFNVTSFPFLLPIGLVLLDKAIKERKQGLSISASPFFAPYVNMSSLPLAAMGLLPHEAESIIAVVGLWVVWGIQYM